MHFLITNDDGIGAPGLELLTEAAQAFGETTTIAPMTEQSGVSHRLSFESPLKLEQLNPTSFQVDGTPGDCIRIAFAKTDRPFDYVLSGINDGANMGVEIYYSGTVAAAREAAILGVPAIAFSQYRRNYKASFDWTRQLDLARRVLEGLLEENQESGCWTNVNFPDVESEHLIEIVDCDADMTPLPNTYQAIADGYSLEFSYKQRPRKSGLDVDNCFGGNVSISRHRIGELR